MSHSAIRYVKAMDGVDVVDKMDTSSQVNLLSVHIVHAVHHFKKHLQFSLPPSPKRASRGTRLDAVEPASPQCMS
jgi:hypothetical protein